MSKYNTIQKALNSTDPATFQQICNAYLNHLYPGYLHSVGSVPGKQKTRRGKPDAYIYRKDGKYILSEVTTQDPKNKSGFGKKLTRDVNDLMDIKQHGIEINDVECIVSFAGTSTLGLDINHQLIASAREKGFELSIIGHDSIIPYLMAAGASVAMDLLGILPDTGQIIDRKRFLDLYGRKKIATNLENQLFGRENELKSLLNAFKSKDCILVKGAPGVGKTKLAIEAVEQFISQFPEYTVYYIYQTAGSIIHDLPSYIDPAKKYILVVDDANRQIENLLSVMAKQTLSKDSTIKIVMTVRDYAKETIYRAFGDTDIFELTIDRLSAEEIYQILSAEEPNLESRVKDLIYNVTGGNARLALMALKVYKEQGIDALSGAAEIFEGYFRSIEYENPILADTDTLLTISLLSFFGTVDFTAQSEIKNIVAAGITIEKFISKCLELQDIEIVDVYRDSTAKINEQVLSTYFFYLAIFKKKVIPFSFFVNRYFGDYKNRMRDSFEGACRAFGSEKVFSIAKADLQNYWAAIKEDKNKALDFIDVFGKYFPDYALSAFYSLTQDLHQQESISLHFLIERKFHPATTTARDNDLSTLPQLFYSHDHHIIATAFELSLQYIGKRPGSFKPLFSILLECFTPDWEDFNSGLTRQHLIFDLLVKRVDSESNRFILYYLFEKIALGNFYPKEAYRLNGKDWKMTEGLELLREKYWTFLVMNFSDDKEIAYSILDEYLRTIENFGIVPAHFDLPYFLKIFSQVFSVNDFDDCFYVQKYCRKVRRLKTDLESIGNYKSRYTCKTYEIYQILTWDADLRDTLFEQYQDFAKVEMYKINEILEKLTIRSEAEFLVFYEEALKIINSRFDEPNNVSYGCDILISDLLKHDPQTGFQVINSYLAEGNKLFISPFRITNAIFEIGEDWYIKFYDLLKKNTAYGADEWKYQFLIRLPENLLNEKMVDEVILFFSTCSSGKHFDLEYFERFLKINEEIYLTILTILSQRRVADPTFVFKLPYNFFSKHPDIIEKNLALSKHVYIQQDDIDRHFDVDCEAFELIYSIDQRFLLEYLDLRNEEYRPIFTHNSRHFFKLWRIQGIEAGIYDALLYFLKNKDWYRNEYVANTFFSNLSDESSMSTLHILQKIISNFPSDPDAINMSVYISRNCIGKYYGSLIQHYLKINPDFELFEKIEWNNNHFSSSGNAIWSDYRIIELQKVKTAIQELNEPVKYYLHVQLLEKRMEWEETRSAQERKDIYRGFR